jgi:heme/copper-type cytochrome/quinol oxidase subunit 4
MSELSPAFFDIFGFLAFVFLTILSLMLLKTKKLPAKWVLVIFLIISLAGLIVDGLIVFQNFISYYFAF